MVEFLRNLIDAANIAALAALSTVRRPECTVGGDDGQQLTIHDPDVGLYWTFSCSFIHQHSSSSTKHLQLFKKKAPSKYLMFVQVREPLPLTIHHLPIAVTFAYFGDGNIMVCSIVLILKG
jgi:exosome complex component RRP45